jgi:hypothetical protein
MLSWVFNGTAARRHQAPPLGARDSAIAVQASVPAELLVSAGRGDLLRDAVRGIPGGRRTDLPAYPNKRSPLTNSLCRRSLALPSHFNSAATLRDALPLFGLTWRYDFFITLGRSRSFGKSLSRLRRRCIRP